MNCLDYLIGLCCDWLIVQVCLLAKAYHLACPIVQVPIYEVEPSQTAVCSLDFLLYFYYSGMVLIGLKRWMEALEALTLCFTLPCTHLSAVAVEAYKK